MKKEVVVAIVLISLIIFMNPELTGDWHKFFQRSRTARYGTLIPVTPTQTQPIGPSGPTAPIPYQQPTAPIAPQPPAAPAPTVFTAPISPTLESHQNTNCVNGIDDDFDGKADCSDPGCFGPPSCKIEFATFQKHQWWGYNASWNYNVLVPQAFLCYDNLDNDKDGAVDCKDPDCFNTCVENVLTCFDGIDGDNDGLADAQDPSCSFFRTESNGRGCIDGRDNDNNGFTDCLDATCASNPICAESGSCWDQQDNDGNGFTDCNDLACLAPGGSCGPTETGYCVDGFDNDRDGWYDCTDQQDCGNDPLCACSDTDGGYTPGFLGQVNIGGVPPSQESYDRCDEGVGLNPVPNTGMQNTSMLIEADCMSTYNTRGHTMYNFGPVRLTNCSTIPGFTICKNGACV